MRLAQRPELGYAIVVADQLMWNGQSVSPNQFARALTGGLRNAWRDLVLLLPEEQQWKPASVRRRERLQATLAPSLPERRAQRMRARTLADLR